MPQRARFFRFGNRLRPNDSEVLATQASEPELRAGKTYTSLAFGLRESEGYDLILSLADWLRLEPKKTPGRVAGCESFKERFRNLIRPPRIAAGVEATDGHGHFGDELQEFGLHDFRRSQTRSVVGNENLLVHFGKMKATRLGEIRTIRALVSRHHLMCPQDVNLTAALLLCKYRARKSSQDSSYYRKSVSGISTIRKIFKIRIIAQFDAHK